MSKANELRRHGKDFFFSFNTATVPLLPNPKSNFSEPHTRPFTLVLALPRRASRQCSARHGIRRGGPMGGGRGRTNVARESCLTDANRGAITLGTLVTSLGILGRAESFCFPFLLADNAIANWRPSLGLWQSCHCQLSRWGDDETHGLWSEPDMEACKRDSSWINRSVCDNATSDYWKLRRCEPDMRLFAPQAFDTHAKHLYTI